MAPTVRDVLRLPKLGLTLVAGEAGLERAIRWAHISELPDPTPWLKGGELLLTTGMGLKGPATLQRAYVRRLVQANLAGLGFGVGFGFDAVPDALKKAAEREGFPVLEVPYPVPFIAIAEAVSERLAQERLKDAQRTLEIHQKLTSLVAHGAGPEDVLKEVVNEGGGWAVLYDVRGDVIATTHGNTPGDLWTRLPDALRAGTAATTGEVGPDGGYVAVGIVVGRRTEAILVWGTERRIEQRQRVLVNHAAAVLGVVLSARRAVVEAERRLVGDVLGDAFLGRLVGEELERRLEMLGLDPAEKATTIVVEPATASREGIDELARVVDAFVGRSDPGSRATVVSGRVVAVVRTPHAFGLAEHLVEELDKDGTERARVGLGETLDARSLRGSYLSAVFALRAAGEHHRVATPRDAGSWGFLLGSQPKPVLEAFVHSVLGPVVERDRERSSELVPSLAAFIEAGGRWEPGADALGVHRHTLRYRVRQAEELLGRDLSTPEGRLDVWLALKALEVLNEE